MSVLGCIEADFCKYRVIPTYFAEIFRDLQEWHAIVLLKAHTLQIYVLPNKLSVNIPKLCKINSEFAGIVKKSSNFNNSGISSASVFSSNFFRSLPELREHLRSIQYQC